MLECRGEWPMNPTDADDNGERRRLRLVRIAWILFFLAPALGLEGYYLHGVAHFDALRGLRSGQTLIWRIASVACLIGSVGSLIGFLWIMLRYGKSR